MHMQLLGNRKETACSARFTCKYSEGQERVALFIVANGWGAFGCYRKKTGCATAGRSRTCCFCCFLRDFVAGSQELVVYLV